MCWGLKARLMIFFTMIYSILQANLDSPVTAEPVGIGGWVLDMSEVLRVSQLPEKASLIRSMVHELRESEHAKSGPKNAGYMSLVSWPSSHQILTNELSQ